MRKVLLNAGFGSPLYEEDLSWATTELRFWARVPQLETLVWYQINDGQNRNNPEDNFGLRTYPERRDKILARMMPKLIEEVTDEEN